MQAKDRSFALAALILLAGTSLPFLGQALHIDDQIYVMGAEIIEADPLRPYSARRGFLGLKVPYYRGINSHPEGLPYYLAAMRAVTGAESETALHAIMLPFLVLLAVGIWGLARELGSHPGWCALLLLSTAPVLVMGHTVMTDLPFIALFCAGLWALLRSHGRGKETTGGGAGAVGWTLLAILLCNYAWFMQYRGLLLLPMGVGWLLVTRRVSIPSLVVLGSIPLLFGGWCAWNQWELGKAHFFFSGGQIEWTAERLIKSAAAMSAYSGVTLAPLCLVVLYRLRGRIKELLALGAASLAGSLLLVGLLADSVPGPRAAMVISATLGLFLLSGAALSSLRLEGEHTRTLILVLVGLAALQVGASLFASVRMLLLPLPFLVLLLVRDLKAPPPRLLAGTLALNLILGLLICWGDRSYADAYRDLAPKVAARATAGGGKGFFVGEWGLRNYLEEQGLSYLTTYDQTPRKGDHVVVPGLNCPWPVHAELKKRLGPPSTMEVPAANPLRTMDPALGAGFYTDGYGLLPFAFATDDKPYDVLKIYPVVR